MRYVLRVLLAISLCSVNGFAGTACSANEANNCVAANTCTGSACILVLSIVNNAVMVQAVIGGQLKSVPLVCVTSGATMQWTTSDDTFFVRFAPGKNDARDNLLPNGQTSLSGGATGPVGGQATIPDCYSYSVAVCDVPPNATGTKCATADPKVVVTGPHITHDSPQQ